MVLSLFWMYLVLCKIQSQCTIWVLLAILPWIDEKFCPGCELVACHVHHKFHWNWKAFLVVIGLLQCGGHCSVLSRGQGDWSMSMQVSLCRMWWVQFWGDVVTSSGSIVLKIYHSCHPISVWLWKMLWSEAGYMSAVWWVWLLRVFRIPSQYICYRLGLMLSLVKVGLAWVVKSDRSCSDMGGCIGECGCMFLGGFNR